MGGEFCIIVYIIEVFRIGIFIWGFCFLGILGDVGDICGCYIVGVFGI